MTTPDETYDDEALAAEYVLHLLEAEARQSFEARLRDSPALRARVHAWEAYFAPLLDGEAVPPPAHLRAAVLAALDAPAPGAARQRRRWWGGALAALAVVAVAVLTLLPPRTTPQYVAALDNPALSLALTAETDGAGAMVIQVLSGSPPDGRVFELWLIAEGAAAPVSLGVIDGPGRTSLTLDQRPALVLANGTLAVSDEPPGGSPTGSPTGSVLATGALTPL